MNWFGWMFVTLLVLNTVLVIKGVDKPREPLSRDTAVAVMIFNMLLVYGIIYYFGPGACR